ncbi:MAG: hypothetical protein IPM69_12530 [Ignavibacteria bacterium]|nr:hypothetical protein [Ignavibacteria bacterium]
MYKNSQGTVGASTSNYPVRVHGMNGADGVNENTVFGFGIMCIGTATPLIQYSTFESNHSVSIASIGRSLSSTLVSQMPNPTVRDNIISGSTMTNTGWHAGLMTAYGGRVTAQRNVIRGHRNTTEDRTGGIHIFDGRTALIGSNSVKTDGNIITDNDWGLNITVTNSIIGTPSSYTIKNNNIVYNGNGGSGLTCTGFLTSGCVRYENTTSTANRSLTLQGNAWGNSDPLNNGYTYDATPPGAAADAFYGVTQGDVMAITSPQFSVAEQVNQSYTEETAGWGYSAFNTIQQAVDAAGNPDTIVVASGNYAENVCVFSKQNVAIIGDSMATCGSGSKPVISPNSGNAMHIFTLSAAAAHNTTNITVNGFFFDQEGAQEVGILTTGWDNTANAANNPPTSIEVRNTCFQDYATQGADGVAAASAAMATEEFPFNNTTRQSYGNNVSPATPDPTDIDAQANNNFNYGGVSTSPSFKLWDKTDEYIAQGSLFYNAATILQTNLIIVFCGDDLNVALGALGAGPVTVYIQGDCIYKSASQLTINGPFDIRVDYTGREFTSPYCRTKWYYLQFSRCGSFMGYRLPC